MFDTSLVNDILEKYKITNDSKSKISFDISYKVKKVNKNSFVKISTNGSLYLNFKNKKTTINYFYDKMCQKQKVEKCLRFSKKKIAKRLTTKALKRIDNGE